MEREKHSFHMKTVVIAIGGNSLIKDREHQTVADQYEAIFKTCEHIADILEKKWQVIITHGNGPQVGFILLRSELARHILHEVPLDSCGADTQGAIGYQISQALDNTLAARGIQKRISAIVTRTRVDKEDPAFQHPTKPIGPFYTEQQARERQRKDGWQMVEDAGRGFRRVVASPRPLEILEASAIRTLLKNGFVVVAAGGGGIPVIRENGSLRGSQAVIDKDLASALLASSIKAHTLLISTSVEGVYLNFGTREQRLLLKVSAREMRKHIQEGHFKEGSMLPKVEASLMFLKSGGKQAIITSPGKMVEAMEGKAGTRITP